MEECVCDDSVQYNDNDKNRHDYNTHTSIQSNRYIARMIVINTDHNNENNRANDNKQISKYNDDNSYDNDNDSNNI